MNETFEPEPDIKEIIKNTGFVRWSATVASAEDGCNIDIEIQLGHMSAIILGGLLAASLVNIVCLLVL